MAATGLHVSYSIACCTHDASTIYAEVVIRSIIICSNCSCNFRPSILVVFVQYLSAVETHTLVNYEWAVTLSYFSPSHAGTHYCTHRIECFLLIPRRGERREMDEST